MAKKETPKTANRKALDAFLAKHKGKALSDTEKDQRNKLRDAVGTEDFKRIATIRASRALRAIDGLAALAKPRYKYTPEQIEKLSKAFRDKLTVCFAAFEGKKTTAAAIEL